MNPTRTFSALRWHPGGAARAVDEPVIVEEALEIRVEGQPAALTMRTPGDDLDLAAGFLWTEGVIDGPDDLRALALVAENVVDAVLAEGVPAGRARRADRFRLTSSACGLCARDTLHALPKPPAGLIGWSPSSAVLAGLPSALAGAQPLFAATGGLHAAALFDAAGTILLAREDVGRHNAVDKVLGARLRADALPLEGLGLLVSSRAGFEIVAKAAAAGLGLLVAVGAPSSLAIEAAHASGLHLWAWARGDRATRYA
jgi:FdhD protein